MATSLVRRLVPVAVGVLLLAIAAGSLVYWFVDGEGPGRPADAGDEMGLACGINERIHNVDFSKMGSGAMSKDALDDLIVELSLVQAAGKHDTKYAEIASAADKFYRKWILSFDLDDLHTGMTQLTHACGDVAATSVPADRGDRFDSYQQFSCRLAGTIHDRGTSLKKLTADSATVADLNVLYSVGVALMRDPDHKKVGRLIATVPQAMQTFDEKRYRKALDDLIDACG